MRKRPLPTPSSPRLSKEHMMMPRLSWHKWWVALSLTLLSGKAAIAQSNADRPAPLTQPSEGSAGRSSPTDSSNLIELPPSAGDGAPSATPADEQDASRAASEVASFAVTRLKDSPAVVTVISGDDIRSSGARDLTDILLMVPGYFTGLDTLGVVGPGFRGIWGYEGKILLIIDGKEMNELLFSTTQLGNEFPVELIERVEVVRGPGSVIYGGNAELSVINVVTRGLQGSTDVSATATYGQLSGANQFSTGYGRRKLTASGRYVVDSVPGLSTFLSLSAGEGQRSVRTFVDNSGMAATLEGNSALNPTVLQMGVGYKDVQASFLYHRLATSMITGFGQVLPAALPIYFDSYHGELVGSIHPTNRVEIVPRFNVTYQTPWRAPTSGNDVFYDKAVRRIRGRLLGRWAALDQLQVTAGVDGIFDEASLRSPANPANPAQTLFGMSDRISYETYAGYVELFSENPFVNISAGARYDHHSTMGGALVPRLVLLRSFGAVSLKGLFSLSFREPGFENINAGVDVRPERTRVFEFEGAIDLTPQQRLSANIFDLSIQAPIEYTVDPAAGGEIYLNGGRQGTRGFEVSYSLRHRLVRAEANYSFYAPSAYQNTPNFVVPGHTDQFLAAPAHRGSARATFRPVEGFGISPSGILLGPSYTKGPPDAASAPTAIQIPAQFLANLFVFRDNVGVRGLRVGLGFYNIFGANYRFVRASATIPKDGTAEAAMNAYLDDHPPLPGLDREILLQASYQVEP